MRIKIKKFLKILITFFCFLIFFSNVAHALASTIATTDVNTSTQYAFQRKAFYANGRFWVFFVNRTDYLYTSSVDGINWETPQTIRDEPNMHASVTTRYFTSWSRTVNGQTNYWLSTKKSDEVGTAYIYISYPSADWGIRVFKLNISNIETEITSGPVAIVTRTSSGEGYQEATWAASSSVSLNAGDAIKIAVYIRSPSGSGTWVSVANFTTKQLEATQLVNSTWKVIYYTDLDTEVGLASFYFGFEIYNSRIENFTITPIAPAGNKFSIWYNGTFVSYALSSRSSYAPVIYRRGKPNADGTITWSTFYEQIAYQSADRLFYPFVSVDSSGYPFIGFACISPYITKSSTNDGTWSTQSGFPIKLSTSYEMASRVAVSPIPLNNNKVAIVYGVSALTLRVRVWNGTYLLPEQEISSFGPVIAFAHSAVADGDELHVLFLNYTTYEILHVNGTYNPTFQNYTFSQARVVAQGTSTSYPVLSLASPYLYAFWASSPQNNYIYYKKYSNGQWDTSPTTFITSDILTANNSLSSYYKMTSVEENKIGLIWMNSTTAPYQIRHSYLEIFLPGWINVSLLNPTPETINEWNIYSSYFVNASVECKDGYCFKVNGTIRYNKTSPLPDAPMNTSFDSPFYILSSFLRPINYSIYTYGNGRVYNPTYAYDNFYNDTSTYASVKATISWGDQAEINYTFYLGEAQTGKLFVTSSIIISGDISLFNFSSQTWFNWISGSKSLSTDSILLSKENGLISSDGYSILTVSALYLETKSEVDLYDAYIEVLNSTLACENLSPNEKCILAWLVRPTGNLGTYWKVDVNFSFDQGFNDTKDATIKLVDLIPPTYSLNSTNSTSAGSAVMHSLFWQDNVGLSYAIFSFDNCTGTFQNITGRSLSGTSAWSNFTVVINSTIGCTIRWRVYANDTSNNWNASDIFSYVTTPPQISNCSVLNQAGVTYYLTADIINSSSTACMNISANNIILDCQGHTIDGIDNFGTYGIYLMSSNVTIRNCIISDWDVGIEFDVNSDNNQITNCSIYSNSGGIVVNGNNNLITNSELNFNFYGIGIDGGSNNTISNCLINSNEGIGGIWITQANNNTITNCTLNSNIVGVYIENSSYNVITNNNILASSDCGIYMAEATLNEIYNNLLNNSVNFRFTNPQLNYWNTTRQAGTRIHGLGVEIGGNYWTNPEGNGYSDVCSDVDGDGFCDIPYTLDEDNIDYLPLSNQYQPQVFSIKNLTTNYIYTTTPENIIVHYYVYYQNYSIDSSWIEVKGAINMSVPSSCSTYGTFNGYNISKCIGSFIASNNGEYVISAKANNTIGNLTIKNMKIYTCEFLKKVSIVKEPSVIEYWKLVLFFNKTHITCIRKALGLEKYGFIFEIKDSRGNLIYTKDIDGNPVPCRLPRDVTIPTNVEVATTRRYATYEGKIVIVYLYLWKT